MAVWISTTDGSLQHLPSKPHTPKETMPRREGKNNEQHICAPTEESASSMHTYLFIAPVLLIVRIKGKRRLNLESARLAAAGDTKGQEKILPNKKTLS